LGAELGPRLTQCGQDEAYLHARPTYTPTFILRGERLHAKFHMNVFIVSASSGQKSQFLANFDIWSCTDSLLLMRAKFGTLEQTHGICLRVKFRVHQFILSSSGGKTPKFRSFLDFDILWCCQLTAKLNANAQLQTFPYPTASKSFIYSSKAFMAKSPYRAHKV